MTTTQRWTSAALDALPDPVDGTRYEIIDGELFVSKQPSWEHQHACGGVYTALRLWSDATGRGVAMFAPGLIFADDEDAVPDVVWIGRERLQTALGADRKLHEAPELVVEVLSPGPANERRDRDAKLGLYSRQGVEEYWIVSWQQRLIDVYRRDGPMLRLAARLADNGYLESPLLPGFRSPVAHLFFPAGGSA